MAGSSVRSATDTGAGLCHDAPMNFNLILGIFCFALVAIMLAFPGTIPVMKWVGIATALFSYIIAKAIWRR